MGMLSELDAAPWDRFPQPSWNAPTEVASAIRALAATTDVDDFSAYNRVLYALGNNHAGTYFPIVLPAVPFLMQIVNEAGPFARLRTLDVLTDLMGSFCPEPKFEVIVVGAQRIQLRGLFEQAVREHVDVLQRRKQIAETEDEAKLVGDLLTSLQR